MSAAGSPIDCSTVASPTLVAELLVKQLHLVNSTVSRSRSLIGIGSGISTACFVLCCSASPLPSPHSPVFPSVLSTVPILSVSSPSPLPARFRAHPGLSGPPSPGPSGLGPRGMSLSVSRPSCPPSRSPRCIFPPPPPSYPPPSFPAPSLSDKKDFPPDKCSLDFINLIKQFEF